MQMRGNNTRLFNNLRDEFPKKSEQGFKLRAQRINCVDRTKSGIKAEGDLMTRTITAGRISTRRFAGTRSNTNIGAIRMIGGPSRLSSPVFRDAKISGRKPCLGGKNREKYREISISRWKVMPYAWPEPIFRDLLSAH